MKGQELCDAYRAEIGRTLSQECAEASCIYYAQGWYYVKIAVKDVDGSWRTWGTPTPLRGHEIVAEVKRLSRRVDYETRQSREAQARKVRLSRRVSVERVWREVSDSYEVRMSVPSSLIRGIQDMRDFRDVVSEAIKVAEGMENGLG